MHNVPRSSSGIKTDSIALPAPTSNNHLRVPSLATSSLMIGGGTTPALSSSVARKLLAKSLMSLILDTPRWCIHCMSCLALKGFSFNPATYAAIWSASKSKRFMRGEVNAPTYTVNRVYKLTIENLHAREEKSNFHSSSLRCVRTMHGVSVNAVSKISTNGSSISFFRIRGTHQITVFSNCAFAL